MNTDDSSLPKINITDDDYENLISSSSSEGFEGRDKNSAGSPMKQAPSPSRLAMHFGDNQNLMKLDDIQKSNRRTYNFLKSKQKSCSTITQLNDDNNFSEQYDPFLAADSNNANSLSPHFGGVSPLKDVRNQRLSLPNPNPKITQNRNQILRNLSCSSIQTTPTSSSSSPFGAQAKETSAQKVQRICRNYGFLNDLISTSTSSSGFSLTSSLDINDVPNNQSNTLSKNDIVMSCFLFLTPLKAKLKDTIKEEFQILSKSEGLALSSQDFNSQTAEMKPLAQKIAKHSIHSQSIRRLFKKLVLKYPAEPKYTDSFLIGVKKDIDTTVYQKPCNEMFMEDNDNFPFPRPTKSRLARDLKHEAVKDHVLRLLVVEQFVKFDIKHLKRELGIKKKKNSSITSSFETTNNSSHGKYGWDFDWDEEADYTSPFPSSSSSLSSSLPHKNINLPPIQTSHSPKAQNNTNPILSPKMSQKSPQKLKTKSKSILSSLLFG